MTVLFPLFTLCVAFWLLGWFVCAAANLLSGKRSLVSYPIMVHFVVCGLPIWFDLIVGAPGYIGYPVYATAYQDPTTTLLYLLFISSLPPLWWFTRTRNSESLIETAPAANLGFERLKGKLPFQAAICLVLFAPLVAVWFAPNLALYASYASQVFDTTTPQEEFFNAVMQAFTIASAFTAVYLVGQKSKFEGKDWYLFLVLIADSYLNGKRGIVILILLMYALCRLQDKSFRKGKVVALLLTITLIGSSFSYVYQITKRPYYLNNSVDKYQDFRIDFGRDHALKTSIYAELNGQSILPERFESLKFYATYFIPRSVWPDKPYPYATYFTSYVYRRPMVKWLGFSLSTTILSEALDNAGWIGLLIGPLIIMLLCRVGERAKTPITRVLSIILANALLLVQMSAFLPLTALWVGFLIVDLKRSRKPKALRSKVTKRFSPRPVLGRTAPAFFGTAKPALLGPLDSSQ